MRNLAILIFPMLFVMMIGCNHGNDVKVEKIYIMERNGRNIPMIENRVEQIMQTPFADRYTKNIKHHFLKTFKRQILANIEIKDSKYDLTYSIQQTTR